MSKFNVDHSPLTNHPIPLKQWTALDHLSHDFANDSSYREHCLEKYGQYMSHQGMRVTA